MMEFKIKTEKLKYHLNYLKDRYENNTPPENRNDKQFFIKMKEDTLPFYELLEKWEENGLQIVKQRKLNVHPHQISSTRENMELLLLHSFYIDAKRKRYMELNHSCHYIFDQILSGINEG